MGLYLSCTYHGGASCCLFDDNPQLRMLIRHQLATQSSRGVAQRCGSVPYCPSCAYMLISMQHSAVFHTTIVQQRHIRDPSGTQSHTSKAGLSEQRRLYEYDKEAREKRGTVHLYRAGSCAYPYVSNPVCMRLCSAQHMSALLRHKLAGTGACQSFQCLGLRP